MSQQPKGKARNNHTTQPPLPPWEIQSDLADALPVTTSNLTGFSALREEPVARDCLAVPHLQVPCQLMDYVAWLCFASASLMVVMGRYYVLAECF